MHSAHRYIAPLFLIVALAAPLSSIASPGAQKPSVQIRVYDSTHKDYHNWDDNENRAWGQYLSENHYKTHDYKKANKREQSQYWNWRHDHEDGQRQDGQRRDDRR
jgi:hypothetical protein